MMAWQEVLTYVAVGAAAGWLAVRWWKGRASGNCCGEKECPAAREALRRIERATRRRQDGREDAKTQRAAR